MTIKIAIIEDNADNRMLLEALLGDDYDIDEYEEGLAGLAGLADSPPDLVLLDISLPGMTGTEVLAKMREDPALKPIPVIALTAHAMPDDRETFLAQGFDDYVSKPIVDEEILFGAIQKLLGARAAP